MTFELNKSIQVLERTPFILEFQLRELSEEWLVNNEGTDTWSPYDIVGHLIHGEKTDWMVRLRTILNQSEDRTFKPFDRFAQFEASKGKSIVQLLDEFKTLRIKNLTDLIGLQIKPEQFSLTGIHPEFGEVTLEQLISTWVVHDLGHLAQISRVMASQYSSEVGPWKAYLGILK